MTWEAGADLVVVGSGVAGLTAALDAAAAGLRTVVVTKDDVAEGSTRFAQGGVAVVLGDIAGDTLDAHVADTLDAGGGLNDLAAVDAVVRGGPGAVRRLRERGALFDAHTSLGRLDRTREGGHSAFRVVHAGGDATGAEIERALVTAARSAQITVLDGHVAVDAVRDPDGRVAGLALLDDRGRAGRIAAGAVLLATGGYGGLFASTTNPSTATGDGVALALRAGATASDLEFVQFHPTVLWAGPDSDSAGRRPLVTEAVRGEGAVLRDRAGIAFMAGVHPLADLAPRDVVSAAITRRMAETGTDRVHLDATGIDGFARRFPTVHASCRAVGIDPRTDPIPVTPAAHYACGGIVTDVDGRTGVPGLYAAGEVARTGLHGANRLASNSLLEGLVVGERAVRAVLADRRSGGARPGGRTVEPAPAVPVADRGTVQRAMTRHAGIGRDATGLAAASDVVEAGTVTAVPVDRAGVEDAALTLLAQAVLAAAGTRRESRGCHVRTDFPDRDDTHQRASLPVRLDATGRPVVVADALAGAA
ncbi:MULTISPECIES: L-aspartate oxidase [unclassified Pseudonocardia]|uniref:L-aspartate oxidase n=1 Tax=unclassified Pseudonocardia TaxID=2619320 RepID=UPI00094B516A|nr:L-aspartate oxidase [Pseudonocardia sp. Ae707_Ps1]OLM17837.1 L-aspartate oxidase [Pseudonocardia sp. Ae707_Ps1]